MLIDQRITPKPDKVFWFYGEWQTGYDELQSPCIEFIKGVPNTLDHILEEHKRWI
jgi:hypothetical protein